MPDPISFSSSSLFGAVDISASAMSGERLRMSVASENLAHAGDTRRLADGMPYQRQRVLFQEALDQHGGATGQVNSSTVKSPKYETRYDPTHPDANDQGIVHAPEVSSILELTDLMTASKAYEANANAARGMLRMHENALRLGQE